MCTVLVVLIVLVLIGIAVQGRGKHYGSSGCD